MSGVDNRVVTMTFDNKVFQQKVGETIGSLDKLKTALNFDAQKNAFADISASAGKVNFSPIHTALDSINTKFLALSTVALTALSNITSKAIDTGLQMAKHLTLDNVIDGFHEYETNINSIQTILANTASKGTNLDQVNGALQQLNEYSDKTIYNFGEMAKNIGTFTAAGVDLDTSVQSIKGIANIAAMSGSSSEQASTAMYQLSQAIATGSMKLMDWNSVVNAGMGGEAMKTALFETGKAMGTLKDVPMGQTFTQWEDAGNSFRDTLQDGWVTADVLTTTLGTFTGDMTKEMLVAKGYSSEVADQILATAKIAQDAATKVKTFTQLLGTTKEQIGTGWADSFRIIIGNFQEAQELFSMISAGIGKVIGENNNARNEILRGWAAFGGRQAMVESLINVWVALGSVLRPIQEAFREVFPPSMGANLVKISAFIRDFTHSMIASGETGEKIKSIFKGIFSIFSIGIAVVKGIVHVFTSLVSALFGLASGGGGGLLSIAAGIGEFVSWIRELLVTQGGIENFFNILAAVLTAPIHLLTVVKDAVAGFVGSLIDSMGGFGGIFSGAMTGIMAFKDAMISVFFALQPAFVAAAIWIDAFKERVIELSADLIPPLNKLTEFLTGVALSIAGFFTSLFGDAGGGASSAASSVDTVTDSVTGLSLSFEWLHTVAEALSSAWGWLTDRLAIFGDQLGDNMSDISSVFAGLGGAIKDMFDGIDWDTVIEAAKVALGGGLLVVINNLIKGFAKNGILSTLTGGLSDSIKGTFDQLTGTLKSMQQQIKAQALMKIAQAIAVLVIAMIALTFVDIADLAISLTAMAVGFGELSAVMLALDKMSSSGKKLFLLSAGLILLALAMAILTSAVVKMSQVPWEELLVGLGGMAVLIGALIATTHLISGEEKPMLKAGLAMIVMALGVRALAWAMGAFTILDIPTLAQGLISVGAALGMMTLALKFIPEEEVLKKGGAMLLLSFAMGKMAGAVERFGTMDLDVLAKGFAGVGLSLLILVKAMNAMPKDLKELALGLLLVAVSLEVIVDAVRRMGDMDLWELIKGLGGLAIALYGIQLAANSMTGAMVGAQAIALMAASLLALTFVIKMMSELGLEGILVGVLGIIVVIESLAVASLFAAAAVPAMELVGGALITLGLGIMAFALSAALLAGAVYLMAQAFAILAELSEEGIKNIINAINSIIEAIPGFVSRLAKAFTDSVGSMVSMVPDLLKVIGSLLDGLLDLLHEYIPKLVDLIVMLLTELLRGIREIFPEIVDTVVELVLAMAEGIRDNVTNIVTVFLELLQNLVDIIIENIPMFVAAGLKILLAFIQGVVDNVNLLIAAGTDMLIQLLAGITNSAVQIIQAVGTMITIFITAITGEAIRIAKAGTDALIVFLGALTGDIVRIADAVTAMVATLILELGNNAKIILDAGTAALIKFLEGLNNDIKLITPHVQKLLDTIFSEMFKLTSTFAQGAKDFILKLFAEITAHTTEIMTGAKNMIVAILSAAANSFVSLVNEVLAVLTGFLDALARAVRDNSEKINTSAKNLVRALIDGVVKAFGLSEILGGLKDAVFGFFGKVVDWGKEAVGAKSPSKEYMKIGIYMVQGLGVGLQETAPAEAGAKVLASNTTRAFNDAMKKAALAMQDMDEFNPTITPVLDLTQVMQDAKALNDMSLTSPIASVSFQQANAIAHTNDRAPTETSATSTAPTVVNFEQNNYSPNALSTNDIYRLTRSQIVLAKKELNIP